MKKMSLNYIVAYAIGLFCLLPAYAAAPLWSFTPLTPTTVFLTPTSSAVISYLVTNLSRIPHQLVMTPIPGVMQINTPGNCPNPFTLSYLQACVLTLQVISSNLTANIVGGPRVCDHGNALQCYQPSEINSLNITRVA